MLLVYIGRYIFGQLTVHAEKLYGYFLLCSGDIVGVDSFIEDGQM